MTNSFRLHGDSPRFSRRTALASRVLRTFVSLFGGLLLLTGPVGCVPKAPLLSTGHMADSADPQYFNQDLSLLAAQAAVSDGDYHIGPEDLLEITLYDIQDNYGEPRMITLRVSNSGIVTLPLVGKQQAEGLTPLQLEEQLRKSYQRFIHEPQVSVFVREYRSYRVSVVGYVKNPGVLELRGRKTLLEALSLVGGLGEEAGRGVRLSRQSGGIVQSVLIDLDRLANEGDIRLNVALLPGDVINVPRAGIFYVEGMVNKPGAYPLVQRTTVSQAIATAGGIDVAVAKASGTTLFRKGPNGERDAIPVDLDAMREGEGQDFEIQPDDVIVIPVSGTKFFIDRLTGLLRVGVNSSM